MRPSLVRALAALGTDPTVQAALLKDVTRGQDFFRSAVIEALGDAQGGLRGAGADRRSPKLDGPLQDDAVVALARIGDKRRSRSLIAQQRHGAARAPAGAGRRHLSARRQLRVARALPRARR